MGEIEATRVDVGALLDVARRYDAVADIVEGVAQAHLARLSFDGAVAGRDYTARGNSLRRTVGDAIEQMHTWSRALREIASALRASADLYVEADVRGAVRLG